ncbi:MAG: PQQ-binding-like beta-propeller repeat protein [Planctomycetota bacterium]
MLVDKGIAYLAAGRSSFLDGGMYICAVDAATGKVLHRNLVCDRDPKTGREPQRPIRGTNTSAGLLAIGASDGEKLAAVKLGAAPVFDGLAVARGKLYLATTDGTVCCLGK